MQRRRLNGDSETTMHRRRFWRDKHLTPSWAQDLSRVQGVWRLIIIQQALCIHGMPVLPKTERKSHRNHSKPDLVDWFFFWFFLELHDFPRVFFFVVGGVELLLDSEKIWRHSQRPAWGPFQILVLALLMG
jgi:hypothetical protein